MSVFVKCRFHHWLCLTSWPQLGLFSLILIPGGCSTALWDYTGIMYRIFTSLLHLQHSDRWKTVL